MGETKSAWLKLLLSVGLIAGLSWNGMGKHFLWSFEGPGGSGYLLGSIHLLKKEFYPLPSAILNAFAECRALAVEADISQEKLAASALAQLQRGMYDENDSLRNHISPETWDLTAGKLEELGMNIDGFSRFKPWMLALTIVSMKMMSMGYDPRWGVDRYFLDNAPEEMEILELEGLEAQMELFDGFSDTMNDRFLLYNIQETEQAEEQVETMITAWLKGDAGVMETMLTRSVRKHPELAELYEVIIYERNRGMTEKILQWLSRERRLFVVVGAAHLVGDKGLIARLKRRGYRLRQL